MLANQNNDRPTQILRCPNPCPELATVGVLRRSLCCEPAASIERQPDQAGEEQGNTLRLADRRHTAVAAAQVVDGPCSGEGRDKFRDILSERAELEDAPLVIANDRQLL